MFSDAFLEPYRSRSDERADAALVEVPGARPGGLLRAVEERAAAGRSACRELLAHARTVPTWVDFGKMAPGHGRAMEHSISAGLTLLAASLVESFASANAAKVLVRSGRLHAAPERRLFETARFVFDIALSRGAPPESDAHRNVLEVRLLHAFIRAQLLGRGPWDTRWGHPINQEDYASTLLMFSHVFVRGLERLGVHFTEKERAGVHHTWRWVGHVMGVDDALLSRDVDEERELYAAMTRRQFVPDDDSRALAHGLLDAMAGKPPFYLSAEALHTLSRRLVGDGLGDALHLRHSPTWERGLGGMARIAALHDRVERRVPLGRTVARGVGRVVTERIIRQGLSGSSQSWARSKRG
ncbi:MAG TPA: oxygenase MpaB family protein [Polyangiaceae bacterium]